MKDSYKSKLKAWFTMRSGVNLSTKLADSYKLELITWISWRISVRLGHASGDVVYLGTDLNPDKNHFTICIS